MSIHEAVARTAEKVQSIAAEVAAEMSARQGKQISGEQILLAVQEGARPGGRDEYLRLVEEFNTRVRRAVAPAGYREVVRSGGTGRGK